MKKKIITICFLVGILLTISTNDLKSAGPVPIWCENCIVWRWTPNGLLGTLTFAGKCFIEGWDCGDIKNCQSGESNCPSEVICRLWDWSCLLVRH
ncbi:MAG: hypothetical protein NTV01_20055 [Bacteroidia bacterium]|nr:hypothetical protein [Bacteroidia bacterium]